MSREQFAGVLRYLAAGTCRAFTEDQAEVYYELLGDLPLEALQLATKQALLEWVHPSIPPVALLRRHALENAHRERRHREQEEISARNGHGSRANGTH